jgi:flagellar biosynthesis repressor protein FlbT
VYKRVADFISEPRHIGTNSLKRYELEPSKCPVRTVFSVAQKPAIPLIEQRSSAFQRHGEVIARLLRVNYNAKGSPKGLDPTGNQDARRTAMALKVELKPHEKIIVGSCVITNTDQRAKFLIEGERLPVLREKDILTPDTADTPAKLIYLAVQLMYISHDPQEHHAVYFDVMRDFLSAVPSAASMINDINNHILSGDYYKALKESKKLIAYEKQLLDQARSLNTESDINSAAA